MARHQPKDPRGRSRSVLALGLGALIPAAVEGSRSGVSHRVHHSKGQRDPLARGPDRPPLRLRGSGLHLILLCSAGRFGGRRAGAGRTRVSGQRATSRQGRVRVRGKRDQYRDLGREGPRWRRRLQQPRLGQSRRHAAGDPRGPEDISPHRPASAGRRVGARDPGSGGQGSIAGHPAQRSPRSGGSGGALRLFEDAALRFVHG